MDDFVTTQEHKEFARRIDDENARQNRRLSSLEDNVKEIHGLTVSVERMAVNMENMLSAIERQGCLIERQGERIDGIEKEPGESYKEIKMLLITTLISAMLGGIVSQLITALF